MRALVATAVVILIALLAAIGLGAFNQGTDSTKEAEFEDGRIDIELIGGKGPGFDVETGSAAPGERERQPGAEPSGRQAAAEDPSSSDQSERRETADGSGPRAQETRDSMAAPVPAQP